MFIFFIEETQNLQEEKPQEKSEPKGENKKKEKSPNIAKKQKQSDLEKKLSELDNLYVPIHWSDYATGLAIGGYDPLSYFISEKCFLVFQ